MADFSSHLIFLGANVIDEHIAGVQYDTGSEELRITTNYGAQYTAIISAGGGGATPTLNEVLAQGNLAEDYDIAINPGKNIALFNGSKMTNGTWDGGLGGYKGIALKCSLDYEMKWEAGRLYILQQDGYTVRWVHYQFGVPTIADDDTLGYVVNSRWVLNDGTVYICLDATTGAAVWELQSNEVPTLSQVLASGKSANAGIIDLDYLDFDTAAAHSVVEGELAWNDTEGTVNLGLKGGTTISNLGQHIHARVVNKTTPLVALTKAGYEVVIVAGATGQRLSVKKAKADNDTNSAGTLGIVCEDIAGNQEGFICSVGQVTNINTTGSLQGETWADGDSLYLSGTIAGAITNVKPTAPIHEVRIGYVEYAHAINGKIYVKIDNGYELDELHNVSITSAANGDFLEYNGTLWVNRGIIYTVELMDALTVDFYAPYDLKINTTTNIKNAPTITILDDGAAYTLTNTILIGSKITVTASLAGVTNLNITKA
jgi:hypothetical protein